ncbi:MAG: DUF1573 domain-containing protein [Anaerolineae bacterium]|nr:DUF1573 domain-containing protein [Anaerolineae bacterium]
MGPQLLVGVLGVVAVIAMLLIGIAIGRRNTAPATAQATQTGQTVQVPAGSVDNAITNMSVAPQPAVQTQKPVSEQEKPITDAPRIAVPELATSNYQYSFGKITQLGKVTRTFQIKNIGKKQLDISIVNSSCGCTSALVGDRNVPPGGETSFRVEFDPSSYQEANTLVNAWVTVASNDPLAPVVKLDFSAEVILKK